MARHTTIGAPAGDTGPAGQVGTAGVVGAPESRDRTCPRPYERPLRSGRAGPWRPLLELPLFLLLAPVVVATVTVAAWAVHRLVVAACGRRCAVPEPLWSLALDFGWIAALPLALALTLRWAGGRGIGSVSSTAGRLRRRRLCSCVPPALVLVGGHTAVLVARDPAWEPTRWPGWGTYAAIVAVTVLVVPLQAAAEEYLTRGWLVQTFAVWTRSRWLAAAPAVAVFVALHGSTDVWVVADLTVFAVAACWITFRTGGLEAAIVLHAVNNVLLTLLAGTQGVPVIDADLPELTVLDVLPGMVVAPLYVWWVARRHAARPPGSSPATPVLATGATR